MCLDYTALWLIVSEQFKGNLSILEMQDIVVLPIFPKYQELFVAAVSQMFAYP